MLRIIDARTGEPADAVPARRALTRVAVHAPGSDLTSLRVLLVADVLVRTLELGGTPVWALLSGGRRQAELRASATVLGIRPFEDGSDAGAGLVEAQVIHVVPEGEPTAGGVRITVAPVGPAEPAAPADGPGHADGLLARSAEPGAADVRPDARSRAADALPPEVPAGTGPAVLRLALLARHHSAPAELEAALLDDARATLARWRAAVARWARSPSRPVPDEVRVRLRDAWEDDLDVPRVLDVLHHVENEPALPDGARFETFAYADRLLGLDLAADLGSPP
ncbi:hypothetical protein [Streptomyces sp. bgisy032]|uniref:hypothetical protein n=1 Tax=Streptomyces sp. bgisy032 TaxID=3413773 RepID=UPI003D74F55C